MTVVQFVAWHREDPLGAREESRANPQPVRIPVRLVTWNQDGTAVIEGDGFRIENAVEGSLPGEWQHRSGLPSSVVDQLRADFANLLQDADPNVRSAAGAVRAALTQRDVGQSASQLRAAALNTQLAGQTRAMAITLLGLLLAEARD
jgi:hypothetical protein